MNWFNIIKITEDELDSVKPWIKDELVEGKKDRGAAYMRLRRNLGRIPTPEEINVELKIKPHRNPYSTMTEKERRKEFRAHRMRLRYRLGRNPTKQVIYVPRIMTLRVKKGKRLESNLEKGIRVLNV